MTTGSEMQNITEVLSIDESENGDAEKVAVSLGKMLSLGWSVLASSEHTSQS